MKWCIFLLAAFLFACNDESNSGEGGEQPGGVVNYAVERINYSVSNTYKHDSTLFTEGLLFKDGVLFESTGSPDDLPQTKSMIGITTLKTGAFEKKVEIDRSKYFGEGIVFFNNKLYQLTYQNQLGFVYDANSFKQIGQFSYNNREGWGLTHDSAHLIMSDGTSMLTFLDTATLKPVKTINVTESNLPVNFLNELEFVKGFIYANVFMTNTIVKIDPATGRVVAKADLSDLNNEAKKRFAGSAEMNGIAYNKQTDKLYVTGKFWPLIFELNFN